MPLTCLPLDLICEFASFLEMIWILITLVWVGASGILSFMIFKKIFLLLNKKITVEWALLPTIWIMYSVYNMVALLTLASVGLIVLLALGGFITFPSLLVVFAMFKKYFFEEVKKSFE